MEHRSEARCVTDLHVVVSCPRIGLFRGKVENLSGKGLYVRTRNVSMCLDVPVTVTLQPNIDDSNSNCSFTGTVVHQNAEGFGVRFGELDHHCMELLRQVLDNSMPQAVAPERCAV